MHGQAPLAERMRPQSLDEYVGQQHLVGEGAVLRRAMKAGTLPSMILWGPPGVGKTTLARLIAAESDRPFHALSAIHSGVKDVRAVLDSAKRDGMFAGRALLFIDEIHRFSKSQQDSLLGAVEAGTITLIGATTENPSFEVIPALRSRCQTYVLESLSAEVLMGLVHRALEGGRKMAQRKVEIVEEEALLRASGGDARRLLNTLELVVNGLESDENGACVLTNEAVTARVQQPTFGLRQRWRGPLRCGQCLHQEHPRQRSQRRGVLFGPHGGRRRRPQIHRPTPAHRRVRRHRQRQSHGACVGQQHLPSGGVHWVARVTHHSCAVHGVFGHQRQEQCLVQGHWTGPRVDPHPRGSARALGFAQRPHGDDEGFGIRGGICLRPRRTRRIQWPRVPSFKAWKAPRFTCLATTPESKPRSNG